MAVGTLLKQSFSEWSEDKASRLAASLAYYTAISLAPILVLALTSNTRSRSQIYDAANNVLAFARLDAKGERPVVCVLNLSPVPRYGYRVGMPVCCRWREVLNTDSGFYGGSGVGNQGGVEAEPLGWHDQPFSAELTLPPLGAVWLVPE